MNSDSPFNKNEIFADEWNTQLAFLIRVVALGSLEWGRLLRTERCGAKNH